MSCSPVKIGNHTHYFGPNEVVLHLVIPDPSVHVTRRGLHAPALAQQLLNNEIIKSSELLSNALKPKRTRYKQNVIQIVTYHRPQDTIARFGEGRSDIQKSQTVTEKDGYWVVEHGYKRNDERIISIDDVKLPLYAIASFTVEGTNDADLLTHLRELHGKIEKDSEGNLDESSQYKDIPKAGTLPLLRAVSPNWYVAAYPNVVPGGGPGGLPVAASTPPQGFHYTGSTTLIGQGSNVKDVIVYILDTIPSKDTCNAAVDPTINVTSAIAAAHPANVLLAPDNSFTDPTTDGYEHVGNTTLERFYCDQSLLPVGPQLDPGEPPHLACQGKPMWDHGTYIASIIHSLAPYATLRLIQILNDYGVGDSVTLYNGLAKALTIDPQHPTASVVINCSFGFQSPSPDDIISNDVVNCDEVLQVIAQADNPGFEDYVVATLISCQELFYNDNLKTVGQQVQGTTPTPGLPVVVAAAGNDNQDICHPNIQYATRPCPRYPANSDYVIGVGALNMSDTEAHYSNIDDDPDSDGLWTFGGESDPGEAVSLNTPPHASIVGMYISPTFPDDTSNSTHLAYWCGTSFATAITSGIIAATLGSGGSLGDVYAQAGSNHHLHVEQKF